MATNLSGIIKCIENDFNDFYDPKYLELKHIDDPTATANNFKAISIRHVLHDFYFNHEAPFHANIYLNEKWPGEDPCHFIKDEFKMLIDRYKKRIENFKNHIQNNDKITFIHYVDKKLSPNNEHIVLLEKLCNIFKSKYPNKQFDYDAFNDKN
jgi:hypothetical protein